MNKECLGKILFGILLGCFLTVSAQIAFGIYTDYVIDEIISKDNVIQDEAELINYNHWGNYEFYYNYDPLSLEWQNETKNINDVGYINGEEISELKYTDLILINNLSFRGYALCIKIVPDNSTQKYYAYNHTEIDCNEDIIIGKPECQEITIHSLNVYLNISNCEELKKSMIYV